MPDQGGPPVRAPTLVKRTTRQLGSLTLLLAAFCAPRLAAQAEPVYGESDFLSRVRQLTFEGRRAGEGYFSPDGRRLVFQSEREAGNPFYQIYLLDLATGDAERVSPGTGKTTCSFIQPGTGDVLFASTHHDPRSLELQREELAVRARGEERRYAWDYDPEMELYVRRAATGELVRLTNARGYDAEASYSPDGRWIVFSSTRDAYERQLDEREAKLLEANPSHFGEIYLMPAEGGEPTRLTSTPGYDGGPFFWPDGSRILWRRFDEDGLLADVYTMRPDGSDLQRLTTFGAMSWAPYAHPSGEYVLFASNKLGFGNFELFMVDPAGQKEPVRVTYTDGFDGLPVPSPDGRTLVWTSTRHGGEGGQLFIGQWSHEKALEALAAAPLRQP
jgi:Tol biopolymer transport system component